MRLDIMDVCQAAGMSIDETMEELNRVYALQMIFLLEKHPQADGIKQVIHIHGKCLLIEVHEIEFESDQSTH